jgi:SOS-response transcriptional repressor LexA
MNSKEIRLLNLRQAIQEVGTQTKLASMVDTQPAYISQILNPTRKEQIGDALARKIESALNKPTGWMDRLHDPNEVELNKRRKAPVISYVQAGTWGELVDAFPVGVGDTYIDIDEKYSLSAFALVVRGDSMTPTLTEGAYIVVDPCAEWKHGSIVVVRQNGDSEVTVKRLQKDGDNYYLKADNSAYGVMRLLPDAHICGVVMEQITKFT